MAYFAMLANHQGKPQRSRRYFTKYLLHQAAINGPKWDYNRQLDPDAIASLPDFNFPITLVLQHHHRHGKRCEPHIRCAVLVSRTLPDLKNPEKWERDYAFVDVPTAFYEQLPICAKRSRLGRR